MNNLFNPDNKFFTFMGKVADLMILNFLCIICCLPIITIGASLTATYYVTMKIVDDEAPYIVKGFFHSFVQNLKQSVIIHVIMILIGVILGFDIYFSWTMQSSQSIFKILTYIFIVLAVFYFMVQAYIYPLLAKFENTTKNLFKNALLMSLRHLPYTLLILFIAIFPFGLALFVPKTFPFVTMLYVLMGLGLVCYLQSIFFVKIFKKYIPEETEESEDSSEREIEEIDSSVFPSYHSIKSEENNEEE